MQILKYSRVYRQLLSAASNSGRSTIYFHTSQQTEPENQMIWNVGWKPPLAIICNLQYVYVNAESNELRAFHSGFIPAHRRNWMHLHGSENEENGTTNNEWKKKEGAEAFNASRAASIPHSAISNWFHCFGMSHVAAIATTIIPEKGCRWHIWKWKRIEQAISKTTQGTRIRTLTIYEMWKSIR